MSLKAKWRPNLDALEVCRQHGRDIARQWALAPLPGPQHSPPNSRKPVPGQPAPIRSTHAVQRLPVDLRPGTGRAVAGRGSGTPWSEVPDNFLCPECSLGKDVFDELATEAK